MSTHNFPGNIKHAPGVVCIVVVPERLEYIFELQNSGKTVVIEHEVFLGSTYKCGCGRLNRLPEFPNRKDGAGITDPIWSCVGNGLRCDIVPTNRKMFLQSWLIPIADPESFQRLFESEADQLDIEKIEEFVKQVETQQS